MEIYPAPDDLPEPKRTKRALPSPSIPATAAPVNLPDDIFKELSTAQDYLRKFACKTTANLKAMNADLECILKKNLQYSNDVKVMVETHLELQESIKILINQHV